MRRSSRASEAQLELPGLAAPPDDRPEPPARPSAVCARCGWFRDAAPPTACPICQHPAPAA